MNLGFYGFPEPEPGLTLLARQEYRANVDVIFIPLPGIFTTYRLQLRAVRTGTVDLTKPGVRFNRITSSNYAWSRLLYNTSTTTSGGGTAQSSIVLGDVSVDDSSPSYIDVVIYGAKEELVYPVLVGHMNTNGTVTLINGELRQAVQADSLEIENGGTDTFKAGTLYSLWGIK